MRQREPLLSLEGLRFIASVGIVISHFVPYATSDVDVDGLAIFVDLFFVISGIVIGSAYGGRVTDFAEYGLFIQRRLARLYPLHFATMLAYIAIWIAFQNGLLKVDLPARYNPAMLFPYFTLTQAWFLNGAIAWNGVTWSISAEMFAYLAFPFVWWALNRRVVRSFAIVMLLAIICAAISHICLGRPFPKLVMHVAQLRALPGFALGVFLAAHSNWLVRALPRIGALLLLAHGAGLVAITLALAPNGYVALVGVWMVVVGAYGADLHRAATPLSWKPLSDLGKLTYSIYLLHPLVATTFLAFVGKRLLSGVPGGAWINVAMGFLLVVIASWISFTYFEEPLRRRLGRPFFRVRNAKPGAVH